MGKYDELYKSQEENEGLEKITPAYFKWEKEGEYILGAFVSSSSIDSKINDGSYQQYVFDTDNGPVKFSCGKVFDSEIGGNLKEGCVYRIEYRGKEKTQSGYNINRFDVVKVQEEPIF